MKFTIVVPTRNRTEPLACTLMGLAELNHENYEVVVSDNSSPEIATENKKVVDRLLSRVPHLYVTPPSQLDMVDHWNFAVEHGNGDYVGIVTDRLTLQSDTLKAVEHVISQESVECVSYRNTTVIGKDNQWSLKDPLKESIYSVEMSLKILEMFSRSKLTKQCPRFLNSFCSRTALNEIKAAYGAVFGGIAPDYGFCFRYLSLFDRFGNLSAPYLIDHSPSVSNGMAIARNRSNAASRDFLQRVKQNQRDMLEIGPLENEFMLLPNVIMREYEQCRRLEKGKIPFPLISAQSFVAACIPHLRKTVRFHDKTSSDSLHAVEKYAKEHNLPAPRLTSGSVLFRAKLRNAVKVTLANAANIGRRPPPVSSIGAEDLSRLLTNYGIDFNRLNFAKPLKQQQVQDT